MDSGAETISDAEELQRVRRQASAVYVKSVVAAAILTAIAIVL